MNKYEIKRSIIKNNKLYLEDLKHLYNSQEFNNLSGKERDSIRVQISSLEKLIDAVEKSLKSNNKKLEKATIIAPSRSEKGVDMSDVYKMQNRNIVSASLHDYIINSLDNKNGIKIKKIKIQPLKDRIDIMILVDSTKIVSSEVDKMIIKLLKKFVDERTGNMILHSGSYKVNKQNLIEFAFMLEVKKDTIAESVLEKIKNLTLEKRTICSFTLGTKRIKQEISKLIKELDKNAFSIEVDSDYINYDVIFKKDQSHLLLGIEPVNLKATIVSCNGVSISPNNKKCAFSQSGHCSCWENDNVSDICDGINIPRECPAQ